MNQTSVSLRWAALADKPAVWSYNPKEYDFHPANVEGFAWNPVANEMVLGLRSPKTNRLTGDAYYYRVTNVGQFLPAGGWTGGQPAAAVGGPFILPLNCNGIRSIDWIPGLDGTGRYLIVAGPSNGDPLAQETGSETFALWK